MSNSSLRWRPFYAASFYAYFLYVGRFDAYFLYVGRFDAYFYTWGGLTLTIGHLSDEPLTLLFCKCCVCLCKKIAQCDPQRNADALNRGNPQLTSAHLSILQG